MKKDRLDVVFVMAMLVLCIALIVDNFTEYDSTKTIVAMTMVFCWDISDTLRKMYKNMKSKYEFYDLLEKGE